MKPEEQRSYNFLTSLGHSNIIHEPDGNIPPDLLIDGKIAIEVRRLNQFTVQNGMLVPNENLYFRLIPKLNSILNCIIPENFSNSVWVMVRYERPLKTTPKLFNEINEFFLENAGKVNKEIIYSFGNNLSFKLTPASKKFEKYYYLGMSDRNSGGYIVSIYHNCLQRVINEKVQRVQNYFTKYSEWWLILVNHLVFPLDELDIKQLKELPMIPNIFSQVLIISPQQNDDYFKYK
jgi:hypothetical protein